MAAHDENVKKVDNITMILMNEVNVNRVNCLKKGTILKLRWMPRKLSAPETLLTAVQIGALHLGIDGSLLLISLFYPCSLSRNIDRTKMIVYRRLTMEKKSNYNSQASLADEPLTDPPADSSLDLAKCCKALGHSVRIRILNYLKEADGCICGKIVDRLPLAQSTVSQHLKVLKEAGLVKGEVEGPRTSYCLDKEKLARFKKLISSL